MIFPNAATVQTTNAPHFFNPAATISQPFAYSGAQITYRDSSWLKVSVCESFLRNECPNLDNCSLAHSPNSVKIESGKVTVCYDFIKRRDCKHDNCKYYHPHDALASAILRRGDDTKKTGSSVTNLGMTLGMTSPIQGPRSEDLLSIQPNRFLSSSQMNGLLMSSDPVIKTNMENTYGLPDLKRSRHDPESPKVHVPDPTVSSNYFASGLTLTDPITQPSTTMAGYNVPGHFNVLQTSPLPPSSLPPGGFHTLTPINMNQVLLHSLFSPINPSYNMETLRALSGQKFFSPVPPYPQPSLSQVSFINQLYYQQLLQTSLAGISQIQYPGSINVTELQYRALEETSVAFINDKGTILETLPVCKDFLQGKCKRNQSCNYVHLLDSNVEIKDSKLTVCKNALKGQCHRPVCKFYHIPTYQLQKLGLHSQMI